jgi:hypothetical protein
LTRRASIPGCGARYRAPGDDFANLYWPWGEHPGPESRQQAFPDVPPCDSYIRRGRERDSVQDFTRHNDGWGELVMNWALPGGLGGPEDELGFLLGQGWRCPSARVHVPASASARRCPVMGSSERKRGAR